MGIESMTIYTEKNKKAKIISCGFGKKKVPTSDHKDVNESRNFFDFLSLNPISIKIDRPAFIHFTFQFSLYEGQCIVLELYGNISTMLADPFSRK